MTKKLLAAALALLTLFGSAVAERCVGAIAARESARITLSAQGTLARVAVKPGDVVARGETLGELATDRVFAREDGVVVRVLAASGDTVSGEVLEIAPVNRYTLYCTVDEAYNTSAMMLVHVGETVYVKCTADGTHRAAGIITQVNGSEYRVATTGGELLMGETVYLYRDAGFSTRRRVGIGTVLAADTVTYEAEGTLAMVDVYEGEYVQRGELLYAVSQSEETTLTAPVDGIVLSCAAQGATLAAGELAFEIAPADSLCVEAQVSEQVAGRAVPGGTCWVILAGEPEEKPREATVLEVSGNADDDNTNTLRVACDGLPVRLGLTAEVDIPIWDPEWRIEARSMR